MKMIIYTSSPLANEMYYLIAKEAAKHGIELEFVTESPAVEKYMLKRNIKVSQLGRRASELIKQAGKLEPQEKLKVLERYDVSLDDLVHSDNVLRHQHLDYQATLAVAYLQTWEGFLRGSQLDLVLGDDGSEVACITFRTVARKRGIPIMYTNGGSILPGFMYWDKTIMLGGWVKKEYLEQELSDSERKKVLQYINTMKEEKPVLGGIGSALFSSKRLDSAVRYHWGRVVGGRTRYYTFSIKPLYQPIIRRARAKKFYSQPDFDEKFIFFPLHVPWDAQITLRAPHFVEQYKPVEMCARNIPQGYTLYVKEHPHSKGFVPLSWLEKMASLPNVKLVPPDINAHDLIRSAQCIITINSDVGWEALLHCKPVVVLADPFYSHLGLTFDVDCLKYSGVSHVTFDADSEKRLPIKIREALGQGKVEEEKVLRLVNAVMKSLYPGSFYKVWTDLNSDADNIRNIVDGILAEYPKHIN